MKWLRVLPVFIIFGMFLFFFQVMSDPAKFWDFVHHRKLMPRAIAWTCLLLSLYGIARRRFSPVILTFLLGTAFFFAYLGRFIFRSMY
ncbi:MAG: hypothetical protein QXS76_00390 [Candidatus Bathyarchaeia archaeon]